MYLIVGLGNPEKKYDNTRHNIGFSIIDEILEQNNLELNKKEFEGKYVKGKFGESDVVVLKPTTYMNLSREKCKKSDGFF